jgi:ribonuclease HI
LEVKAVKITKNRKHVEIYTDGAGADPHGKGSGFAWLNTTTREKKVESVPGLTNNVAEYRGVIAALKSLHKGAVVNIFTDSTLIVGQLRGEYRIRDSKLEKLATEVKTIVDQQKLTATFTWVRRQDNLAGKLL